MEVMDLKIGIYLFIYLLVFLLFYIFFKTPEHAKNNVLFLP